MTATGRILASDPDGWRGGRVTAPEAGGRVALPDGRTAVAETLGQAFVLRTTGIAGDRPSLVLRLLGDEQPCAFVDGRRVPLSLRHAELLALLALHPRGLTCEQSSARLYGDEGNPATVRAEIHRLRAQLGDVLRAKPYRLDCDVDADFLTVRRLLSAGEIATAYASTEGRCSPARSHRRFSASATNSPLSCGDSSCTAATWTPCGRTPRPGRTTWRSSAGCRRRCLRETRAACRRTYASRRILEDD